jgi:tetratricopeptide (TPR) repeat protein
VNPSRLGFAQAALETRGSWLVVAGALVALAAWPGYLAVTAHAAVDAIAVSAPAPVKPDYRDRDEEIAWLERDLGHDRADQIVPRMLSTQYLQRYRERGDVGDVLRAERTARLSLANQPHGNLAGDLALYGSLLTLHRFHDAEAPLADALRSAPDNVPLAMSDAGLALELGDYARAERRLRAAERLDAGDPAVQIISARYAEETGRVADARALLIRAMQRADAIYDTPAERRAWFHFRLGELKFLAGDNDGAIAAERDAIAIYPDDYAAYNALARDLTANHRWAEARDAAARGVALVPSPETLGYLADAEAALGDAAGAAATRDEIVAVERIGNAEHLSDRLLAVYYADHDVRLADALAIARRERTVRDDIYTEDTLAWTAAKAGRWDVARAASRKALRFDTEDPRLQYHAGFIALHFGAVQEAKRRFARALALNPHFHPVDADQARAELARLGSRA